MLQYAFSLGSIDGPSLTLSNQKFYKKNKQTHFCIIEITIFTENGWDTIANVMKNVFMKFESNPATHF